MLSNITFRMGDKLFDLKPEAYVFNGADLTMLSFTTGVTLASGGAAAFAGVAGRPGKWCDNCPHPGGVTCFCDPAFEGPPPAAVYLNRERWRSIEKARHPGELALFWHSAGYSEDS